MKKRRICLESLEDRCLLAIIAGGIEMAAELAAPTEAAAWVVNTLEDSISWDTADDTVSLREAIGRAQTGDTITFDTGLTGGTITLSGTQLEIDKGITIDASSIGGITIDADGQSRVFYINGGDETNPVELIGLTVTGGSAYSGGGIYNSYGTVTLTNSTVSGNTANVSGGGIGNYGTLTLTNSTVSGNTANRYGGGIDNYDTLTLTNSTVSGNTANRYGGGIDNYDTLTLTNTIVSLNYASYDHNICHESPLGGSNNIIGLDPGFAVAPIFEDGVLVNANELDLSLTAESVAIDAGTNAAVETETDLAGNPRIIAAWREMATVDIGAYEYQGTVTRGPIEMPSIVVTTPLDIVDETDGLISLREAISYAAAGDTITFDPALSGRTIVLAGAELMIDRNLTIDATSVNGITIDADGKSRVFYISNGNETNPVELIGLTITGGSAYDGGGIYIDNGRKMVLINSTVSGNTANRYGGGIYNDDYGTLTLTNSTVSGNTANRGGGGICNDGTLTLTNSTVSGNTAEYGGGIYNYGTLALTNSTVSGNTANDHGGGIYNDYYGTLTLTNTIVSLNYASYDHNIRHESPLGGSNNIIGLDPGFAVAPIFEDGVLVNANELDLSLTAESVAIDAGTNAAVETDTDLAGNPRIVAAWRETATVDIGAYEYQGRVTRGPIETPSVVVTTTLDIVDETDGLISLREAISYAAAGDTITFDPALSSRTIVLAGAELTIDRNLTIDASAAGGITIDADGKSRVFYISGGNETNPVELIGLTITGGCTEAGGGIYNGCGTVTLTNSTVSGNTANWNGGGIFNDDGTVTLTNSTVSGNTAEYTGGGIENGYNGTLTLTNSTVSGNTAEDDGGGIYNYGTVTFTNSTVSGNTANWNGGGIRNSYDGTVTLTNSTVSGNTACWGGGIYNYGTVTFTNSTVSGNTACWGGGIYNEGTVIITGSTIVKNTASNNYDDEASGGGIYNYYGTVTLTNSTVSGNTSEYTGGGIFSYDTVTITNCTIADNIAEDSGSGIYQSDSYYSVLTLRNSIVVNNTIVKQDGEINGCNVLSQFTDWDTGLSCIQYNPAKPLFTDPENGDYTLAENSQAIDMGNNEYIAGYDTDLAGNPRIFEAWLKTPTVDIGAYEYQQHVAREIPSTVVTTNLDIIDETDGLISLREAVFYAAEGETVTFDDSLTGEEIILCGTQLEIDKGITIDASSIGGITINADGQSRVFYVRGGNETNPVELINLTVTDGNAEYGGGIYNSGSLTLTNSTVSGNIADSSDDSSGGGIFNSGALTLTNSTVSGNTSNDKGGGIYNDDNGTLTLTDSTVEGNTTASNGGGIFNYGTLTLTNTTVSGNAAVFHGGGIYNFRGTLILTDSTVEGNTAEYTGGGICNDGTLTLTNSTVSGNTAYSYGGGIRNDGTLTLTNSTVSGNTAEYDGGGIYNYSNGMLTLINSTVSGNTANRDGGGIGNSRNGTATVTNCTIADNIAEDSGSGIYQTDSDSVLTLRNSIVVNNAIVKGGGKINGCNVLSQFTRWDTDSSCIQYDPSKPLFADPENGNYTLAENSQAIDKGNNEYIAGYNTDLAGNPRIVNGIVDLGAYEYRSSKPLPAPTITTGNMGVYVSYGANRHQITWTAVKNASGYELAYTADGKSWTTVAAKETSTVITGLAYGAVAEYCVRALGTGSYTDSGWSGTKSFVVCPADINNDGDITGADRAFMVSAWLSEEGEEEFVHYADINGDGDVTGADRAFLVSNWLLSVEDDAEDLVYPPAKCADAVFNEFASADLDTDLDVF